MTLDTTSIDKRLDSIESKLNKLISLVEKQSVNNLKVVRSGFLKNIKVRDKTEAEETKKKDKETLTNIEKEISKNIKKENQNELKEKKEVFLNIPTQPEPIEESNKEDDEYYKSFESLIKSPLISLQELESNTSPTTNDFDISSELSSIQETVYNYSNNNDITNTINDDANNSDDDFLSLDIIEEENGNTDNDNPLQLTITKKEIINPLDKFLKV